MSQGIVQDEKASNHFKRRGLSKPRRGFALVLTLLIMASPAWLFAYQLRGFVLQPTDFVYVEDSRDFTSLQKNLLAPLNTHVVPLFRIWTYTVVRSAGNLDKLPNALRAASYFSVILTMLLTGWLVRRETGQTTIALISMAFLGLSSVLLPAYNHFAAGQALWAGAAVVACLIAAEAWRRKGGTWRLVITIIGVIGSPAIWSGGLSAGLAVAAALWADGKPRCRRMAPLMVILSGLCAALIVWMSRSYIRETPNVWERHDELWPRPIQAVFHSCQAIVESLLLNNLGLDAETTPMQALVIVAAMGVAWFMTRGRFSRITPLEAGGTTVIIVSCLMTYFFRGNMPFSSIRPVGWYYLMPQVGMALLAPGWYAGLRPTQTAKLPGRLTGWEAVGVVSFCTALLIIQSARLERLYLEGAPPLGAEEASQFALPHLQWMRAVYFVEELQGRQHRALARLDRAQLIASHRHFSRAAIRKVFGRVLVPGLPENLVPYDAAGLLSLSDEPQSMNLEMVRASLAEYYREEHEPPLPWLSPSFVPNSL